ncbi:hypothetical protein BB934_34270 (plasmid) [Microvirga ossetica]|uniref:Uncharacterized protein n=1 Tax=Microvirga ossetica TaxID=1882682 RepID=A0A1B2ETQ1_9HYPH|nr:DUF3422 family protein [Microvirga ossetica]ANY83366.1 hypothetical protein BB934_34270 [Microvirga ossetica]
MSGLQTIAGFMDRRFQPAMRILISTAERLESLPQRTIRASDQVRTGIDVTMAEQQELLSAAQALARLVTELAAEDTFFSYLR